MKKIFLVMASIVFLMAGVASADNFNLGDTFNQYITLDGYGGSTTPTTVGGGSIINTSILGGTAPNGMGGITLPWVYCIGLYTTVTVSQDYPNTIVTHDGTVIFDNASYGPKGDYLQAVPNAAQVAWLLSTYAVAAEGNTQAQIGLQAAIWATEYSGVTLDPSMTSAIGIYTADLAALAAAGYINPNIVNNFSWLTPADSNGTYQPLITTPEPVTLWLYGFGLVALGVWRKFRKA